MPASTLGAAANQSMGGFATVALVSTATALDPLTLAIADGLTVRCYVNGDLGVTEAGGIGTGVSTWTDQHTSANDITQATLASRPLYLPRDSSIDNHGVVYGNGASRRAIIGSYNPPAPATTPTFIWTVAMAIEWVSSGVIVAGDGTNMRLQQGGTEEAPVLNIRNNTSVGAISMPTETWLNIEGWFSSGANSRLRVGATESTGLDCGNNNPSALGIFANTVGGSGFSKIAIQALLVAEGTPSGGFLTALRNWTQDFYPEGVVTA